MTFSTGSLSKYAEGVTFSTGSVSKYAEGVTFSTGSLSNTPKAFANSQPKVGAQRQPWVICLNSRSTLKGFANRRTLSGFRRLFAADPRVLAALEPWADISERLRRIELNFNWPFLYVVS